MRRSDKRRALRAAAALVSCHLPATLKADAGEAGTPKWQQLFPLGTFHNGGWPKDGVTVDAAFCKTMVANWEKRGKPELSVDYFHKGNEETAPNEERIAAGGIQQIEARDDGLWGLIDWTDRARAGILARELKFLSPEFHTNGIDGHTGKPQGPTLIGAGLVNNPAFKEMPRVAASEVVDPPAQPAVQENLMNREQINALLKTAGINLASTATDAEALAALSKHVGETAKASADAAAALKAKETTDAEALKAKATAEEATKTLKAQLAEAIEEKAKLGVRVANIEKVEFDRGVTALCARAISERRIVASAQEQVKELAAVSGLEKATKFVDGFPKGSIGGSGTEVGHGEPGDVDATEMTEVKAAATEKMKAGLTGAAALRAAAMENPAVMKKLAAVPASKN